VSPLVWGVEWKLALADRRALALTAVLPLALVTVIYTEALSGPAGRALCVALFLGLAMLRTSLPLLRDERTGLAARVMRGGVSSASYLLQRAAAGAALILLSLIPSLVVVAIAVRASVVEALIALAALAVTLWIASLLGVLLGAVSKSTSEILLVSAVLLVALLHVSGVFHTPAPDGLGEALEGVSPFRMLHEAFVEMSTGGRVNGAFAAVAWAVLLPTVVGLLAPRLLGDVRSASRVRP
jgi:hypothetical protein